jgi:hypothetical protein
MLVLPYSSSSSREPEGIQRPAGPVVRLFVRSQRQTAAAAIQRTWTGPCSVRKQIGRPFSVEAIVSSGMSTTSSGHPVPALYTGAVMVPRTIARDLPVASSELGRRRLEHVVIRGRTTRVRPRCLRLAPAGTVPWNPPMSMVTFVTPVAATMVDIDPSPVRPSVGRFTPPGPLRTPLGMGRRGIGAIRSGPIAVHPETPENQEAPRCSERAVSERRVGEVWSDTSEHWQWPSSVSPP